MSDAKTTVAEPKTFAAVISFLDRQKVEYSQSDEQYCCKVAVRNGPVRATVSVYNSGRIVVGGPDSPLKTLLVQMKDAIEAGNLMSGEALPFEIDKFPETIKERIPEVDPVIVRFVDEAIRCYKTDALLASAFMIGAASERAINLLIYAYGAAISDSANRDKFFSKINNRMISKKYDDFLASYKGCKSRPTDAVLSQDLDVVIGTMFQFCRITRNEVGHPQIVPDLDKGVILANLGNVVTYLSRIYALMKHFKDTGVQL